PRSARPWSPLARRPASSTSPSTSTASARACSLCRSSARAAVAEAAGAADGAGSPDGSGRIEGFLDLDLDRASRRGAPEAVLRDAKSVEQVAAIAAEYARLHETGREDLGPGQIGSARGRGRGW